MKSSKPKYVCDRILVLQIRHSCTNKSEEQSTHRYIQGETVNKIPTLKHLSASHHNDSIQRHPPLPFILTMSDPRAIARERERESTMVVARAPRRRRRVRRCPGPLVSGTTSCVQDGGAQRICGIGCWSSLPRQIDMIVCTHPASRL